MLYQEPSKGSGVVAYLHMSTDPKAGKVRHLSVLTALRFERLDGEMPDEWDEEESYYDWDDPDWREDWNDAEVPGMRAGMPAFSQEIETVER